MGPEQTLLLELSGWAHRHTPRRWVWVSGAQPFHTRRFLFCL